MFRPAVSRSFHPNWARGQLPAHPHNASRPFDGLLSGLFSACSHQPTPKERQRQHPNAWKKCGVNSISESRLGRRSGRPLSQRRPCARSTEYVTVRGPPAQSHASHNSIKFRSQQQFQLIYATYSAPRDPHEEMMDKFNCSFAFQRPPRNLLNSSGVSLVLVQDATVVPKTSTFQDVYNMAKVDLDKNRDIETSLRT
ncbi:uncharacterized protein CIMG_00219 [Coccidioides immitis RS]|uniref:Uncharacterized protein n=1 Tax=Coccidioides immitis (strain RS) TaxID=246410 RepID=J3KGJ3_COCIM|nr:uncharacterized protein CIMG_00219 [Coccidioides immitis RS]EAS34865.3 hypothetical protein CIMG_00219 [Coccidioides immitis RS]